MMRCLVRYVFYICLLSLPIAYGNGNFSGSISQHSLNQAFHHHIHNFYFNESDIKKPDYFAMHTHAKAMSYDGVTHYLAKKLPNDFDGLNRILLHNAYYIPLVIDYKKHQVKYSAAYQHDQNISPLNAERIVWKDYPINVTDIALIKTYGCAKSEGYQKLSIESHFSDAKRWLRIDKDYQKIIVNWQSRYVVDTLVKHTISTMRTGKYDTLFIDDLPRNPGACMNKASGGQGSYDSWKDGQLDFLQKVTTAARKLNGYHGKPMKVFGNIWSPYADSETANWYANNQLRLDHYYFESGGFAKEDILYGQKSNTKDPETGLPAFKPIWGSGYIPTSLISLSTNLNTMYQLAKQKYSQSQYHQYLAQHYKAAGIAASQGSWFGWYGETSVDKRDQAGKLIHSNLMQLLRAMPNWENMANIPLSDRQFDGEYSYKSTHSEFNQSFAKSKNPTNQETYMVFQSLSAKVPLKGVLKKAYFVGDYFEKTNRQAMTCLKQDGQWLTLLCPKMIGHGIRANVI